MSRLEKINSKEAIQMAVALEEQGLRFYLWAAGQVTDAVPVEMFQDFAEDEREHANIFKGMADSPAPVQTLFDEQEAEAYLGALMEDTVFPDYCQWDKQVERFHDTISIVNYAIKSEKDSIRLYTEMMIQAKALEAKKTLRAILEEEKRHLDKLEKYLSTLS